MSEYVGTSLRIPNFLTAGSAIGLRRLMLLNNTKKAKQYNYFDIQFVSGKWFAWYYDDEAIENLLTQKESIALGGTNGNSEK